MRRNITIDKAGRIVLPQEIRLQFHLLAGDQLNLDVQPDGIVLRPRSRDSHLVEERGLLVHEGEATGDLARAIEWARSSRDADMLGRPA